MCRTEKGLFGCVLYMRMHLQLPSISEHFRRPVWHEIHDTTTTATTIRRMGPK